MATFTHLRHEADRIAATSSDQQLQSLARVVVELIKHCEATEKTAKDAQRDARAAKKK